MSADNWAVCPRCEKRRQVALADQLVAVAADYGKVSIGEFDRRRAEYDEAAGKPAAATFREDYEIYGAEDGAVNVSYSGSCQTCGLELHFKESRPLDVNGAS